VSDREQTISAIESIINHHVDKYKTEEMEDIRLGYRFYTGKSWVKGRGTTTWDEKSLDDVYASKNLIFPIADSMRSNVISPEPKTLVKPKDLRSRKIKRKLEMFGDWIIDTLDMIDAIELVGIDGILTGRANTSVKWSDAAQLPVVHVLPVSYVFTDDRLEARQASRAAYHLVMEMVPLSIAKARYPNVKIPLTGDSYPDHIWLTDTERRVQSNAQMRVKAVKVWTYTDLVRNKEIRYHQGTSQILEESDVKMDGLTTMNLHLNGVDRQGLSEVRLVLEQQVAINQLMSLWKKLVYMQLPKILYKKGAINAKQLEDAYSLEAGMIKGVEITDGQGEPLRFDELFYKLPVPSVPPEVIRFIERLEADAGFISVLSEAARGQVAGVRTATEMSVIEANLGVRIAPIRNRFNRFVGKTISKAIRLCGENFTDDHPVLELINSFDDDPNAPMLTVQDLRRCDFAFTLEPYNSIRRTPGMETETIQALLGPFLSAPEIDNFKLLKELLTRLLPGVTDVMVEQVKQEQLKSADSAQTSAFEQASKNAMTAQELQAAALEAQAGGGPQEEELSEEELQEEVPADVMGYVEGAADDLVME
jgi:hypothetical protein